MLARAGERSGRIGLDLDLGEVPLARGGELLGRQRARVRGRRRDEPRPARGERARASRRRPCRAGSRRTTRVVGAVELRRRARRRRRRCARRPETSSPRRSSRPGQRDLDLALDRPPEERLRRLARAADDDVRPGRGRANSSSGSTAIAPSWTTASFSAAISSRVSPSTSVCSRPTFVSRTTCERRTFVASSRPPRPASTTATSTSRAANSAKRGRADRLELRRPCASASGRTRATARLEVGLLAVDA